MYEPHFNGPAYEPSRDWGRLNSQYKRVFKLMSDGVWRTLQQISYDTGDPTPSVSAQLRHMRKERFGFHRVNRRHVKNGLYEYQLVVNEESK